jgi:hypothetical protein
MVLMDQFSQPIANESLKRSQGVLSYGSQGHHIQEAAAPFPSDQTITTISLLLAFPKEASPFLINSLQKPFWQVHGDQKVNGNSC